ncbi:MAG: hypothetical protein WC759_00545 [Candidatus Micrarchaeia archaeon]|jgi:hypothetical protein
MHLNRTLVSLLLLSFTSFAVITLLVLEVVPSGATLAQSVSPASPQNYSTAITFQCSYRNDTGPIGQTDIGNNCSIILDSVNYTMSYNAAIENYTLTNDSIVTGTHTWYCACVSFLFTDLNGTPETYVIQSSGTPDTPFIPSPDHRISDDHRLAVTELLGKCIAQQVSVHVATLAGTNAGGVNVDILYNDGKSGWTKYASTIASPFGNVNFIPLLPGMYEVDANQVGFRPSSNQISIADCAGEQAFQQKKDLYLPCTADSECKSGACSENICKPITCECGKIVGSICVNYGCCSDSDCPSNNICRQNMCERKPNCESDSNCEPDRQCSDGFCDRIKCPSPSYIKKHACTIECLSASDCSKGQDCYKNACVRILSEEERHIKVEYVEGKRELCTVDGLGNPIGTKLDLVLPNGTAISYTTPDISGCISSSALPLGKVQATASKDRYGDATVAVSITEPASGLFSGIPGVQALGALVIIVPVLAVAGLLILRSLRR